MTKTVSVSGGTLSGTLNGHAITVTVPPGAVTQPTAVALTWGTPSEIGDAGVSGDSAVIAVGVAATNPATGNPLTVAFGHPVTVTITGPFNAGDTVVAYNVSAAHWAALPGAAVTASTATLSMASGSDIAVMKVSSSSGAKAVVVTPVTVTPTTLATVAPVAAAPATTGTTDVSTGEPFLFEEILAGTLVAMGLASLIILTGRRRSA